MITDEVTDDEQFLLFNINDMKYQREKACEEIKNVFGMEVSVKLSDEFNIIDKIEEDAINDKAD